MTFKLLTTIFVLVVVGLTALGQTEYSESKPYKPRPPEKSDKKKKSDKKSKNAPIEPVPVPVVVPHYEDVTIPISVFDKSGGFVSGITKENVTVYVDGTEEPVIEFTQENVPPTVLLVLDSSPSAELRFESMREHAWSLVQSLPASVRIAVMEFDTDMRVLSQPTTVRANTKAALAQTQMGDGTSLYSAVAHLYTKILPQVPGRKIVVMLTDGVDTTSKAATFASSLVEVEKKDVSFYPVYVDTQQDQQRPAKVSVGSGVDDPIAILLGSRIGLPPGSRLGSAESDYKRGLAYLEDLSAASGGRVFRSDKLEEATKSIASELSSRYFATVKVEKKGSGSREIRVRINRPELTIFARGSFVDQ